MAPARALKVITLDPGCGYGDAACQYIAGLDALGVPVTWMPLVFGSNKAQGGERIFAHIDGSIRERVVRSWQRRVDYDALLLDLPPPSWHAHWVAVESHARPFAYAAHEVDRLPDGWAAALNRFERVFVPSEFNRKVFVDDGVEVPVDVVPHAARKVYPVAGRPQWGTIDDDDFVFYTVGDWTARKAMEETVRTFLETFDATDKVALVIKTSLVDAITFYSMPKEAARRAPPHVGTTWWSLAHILADYPKPAKVHLIAGRISPREIDLLHTRGDCCISLAYSEGWGLVPFDALLFGNPVIVTGWGGHLEYVGDDYPLAVRYELASTLDSPRDGHHFRSVRGHWARADRDHAGALMRSVFERPEPAHAVARELRARLQARFAPATVCARLAELMGFSIAP